MMGDNDGWITTFPNVGESIEVETEDGVFQGTFEPATAKPIEHPDRLTLAGNNPQGRYRRWATVTRWRRLRKRELPEFARNLRDRHIQVHRDTCRRIVVFLEAEFIELFDTTKFPHLAVVEKPAEDAHEVKCPLCDGDGQEQVRYTNGEFARELQTCGACKGEGGMSAAQAISFLEEQVGDEAERASKAERELRRLREQMKQREEAVSLILISLSGLLDERNVLFSSAWPDTAQMIKTYVAAYRRLLTPEGASE